MAPDPSCIVLHHLRRLALHDGAGVTDGELLNCFLHQREDAALAALVKRHGPIVWGVCRRMLRSHHDAEDAFQATFLVLLRKAAAIRDKEAVANWLYGVAHQTALRLRAMLMKRRGREQQVSELPEPAASDTDLWDQFEPLLDQELSRLPEKYRILIVLCDLEGKTRKEAAQQLACPEGTVAGRLARARTLLAKRLTRRGLVISGGLLAALLTQHAVLASPLLPPLTPTTPPEVAALAEGVIRAMRFTKLKTVLASIGAIAAAIALVWSVASYGLASTSTVTDKDAAQPAAGRVGFTKVALTAEDLVAATGLNIYKFQLDIPNGTHFTLMVREVAKKGAEPRVLHQHKFEKSEVGPTTLCVSFLRRDRKLEGILLSQEADLEYRVDLPGCSPSGIATNISNPLASIPGTEKLLVACRSDKQSVKMDAGATRLVGIFVSKQMPIKDVEEAFPRAELVIIPTAKFD